MVHHTDVLHRVRLPCNMVASRSVSHHDMLGRNQFRTHEDTLRRDIVSNHVAPHGAAWHFHHISDGAADPRASSCSRA